jgi:hypothetical protein
MVEAATRSLSIDCYAQVTVILKLDVRVSRIITEVRYD